MSTNENAEQSYWSDVRSAADDLESWVKEQLKDDISNEALREALIDHTHEYVDGHSRVIYTGLAKECVCISPNDGHAVSEGLVGPNDFRDGIPWSALAYCAFEQDIFEELDSRGHDVNRPDEWFAADDDEAVSQ